MDVAALQQALRDLGLEPATTSVLVLEGMLRNELKKHAHLSPAPAHQTTVIPSPAMAARPAPLAQIIRDTRSEVGPSVHALTPEDVWASSAGTSQVEPLDHVPAHLTALVIKELLSGAECRALVDAFPLLRDAPGYMPPEEVAKRYRDRVVHRHLIHDSALSDLVWNRLRPYLPTSLDGGQVSGLSPLWRLLHYEAGGHQACHVDGREPSEPVQTNGDDNDGKPQWLQSRLTVQMYLNNGGGDEFDGGELSFYDSRAEHVLAKIVPGAGDCVLFYQELSSPYALLHEGSDLSRGNKYAMRTMVEYVFPTYRAASENNTLSAVVAPPPMATASKFTTE